MALGLWVAAVKGIISSVLFSIEVISSVNAIYKAHFTPFSNNAIGYFVQWLIYFDKRFSFAFSSSTIMQILVGQQNEMYIIYVYQYKYILGFEMALKKIKTEKTKNRKLTWYFNRRGYVELLLQAWFVVGDGRSGRHTPSQISTTCIYRSNLKPNQWQFWYIDTPIDNVIKWLMRNIHTKSKLVNSMTSAISFTNQGISPV